MKYRKIIRLSLVFILIFILTGCVNKTALTSDEFMEICEENEYEVEIIPFNDGTTLYKVIDDKENKISFWECNLNGVEQAKEKFYYIQDEFEDDTRGLHTSSSVTTKKYQSFKILDDKTFEFVSRIDNTVLVIDGPVSEAENMEEMIEKLGY